MAIFHLLAFILILSFCTHFTFAGLTSTTVSDKAAAAAAAASGGSGAAAAAAAAADSSGCFSLNTLITLVNQQQISIGQLQPGDRLLTIDGSKIVTTEMMMMLHQNLFKTAIFRTFTTESGHQLSATEFHLIPTITNDNNFKYKLAKNINVGDRFRVVSNGHVYSSAVVNITMEVKTGVVAPLTLTGTLLVNGILASSFANVENQALIQFLMIPGRWYYQLSRLLFIEKPFGANSINGMHYLPKMLFEFAQTMCPSILRLS